MLYAVPDDKVSGIENNRYVDSFYTMKQLGYAYLDGSVNNSKPYLNVLALDDKAFESSSIKLTEGRLPVNDSELVISAHIKTNGGVKYNIGDKLTLDLGEREYAGSKLYQNSYYIDGEELVTDTTKTYTIVGICERPGYGEEARSAPGYSVFTSVNSAASQLANTGVPDKNVSDDDVLDANAKTVSRGTDIYLRYNKAGIKEAYRVSADILGVDRDKFESINSKSSVSLSDSEYDKFIEKLSKTYAYYLNDWLIRYESNNLTNSSIAFVSEARKVVRQVYLDEKIEKYIVDIVFATRYPEKYDLKELKDMIGFGGSPRASINLALAARSYAFIKRRGYVIPEDVRAVAHDVLRHRIGLTYEAEASNMTSDEIVSKILNKVEVP